MGIWRRVISFFFEFSSSVDVVRVYTSQVSVSPISTCTSSSWCMQLETRDQGSDGDSLHGSVMGVQCRGQAMLGQATVAHGRLKLMLIQGH